MAHATIFFDIACYLYNRVLMMSAFSSNDE